MLSNQTTIDAHRVMAALMRYSWTHWSVEAVSWLACMPLSTTADTLSNLQTLGYVSHHKGGYRRTQDGINYYEDAMSAPSQGMHKGLVSWKEEALTGIKVEKCNKYMVSKPTDMENCAIPKSLRDAKQPVTADMVVLLKQLAKVHERIVASELGVPVRRYRQLRREGRVALCCGYKRDQHIGRFHKKGTGLQHLCVVCRKQKRKEAE